MRLLVVADIHGKQSALQGIIEKIAEYAPDIVIVCGDITDFGKPQGWVRTVLESIPVKTLAIPGNCDPSNLHNEIEQTKAENLHGKKVDVDGYRFVGLGGSHPPIHGPMFLIPEDEIFSTLDALMERGVILVVHAPAKGHLDAVSGGLHTGSVSIARIVEKYEPRLVLSGHIHEARGVEKDENTVFVNPGPAFLGYAAVVDIGGGIKVDLIE